MKRKLKNVLWILAIVIFIWVSLPLCLDLKVHSSSDGKINLRFFLTHASAKILKFQWNIFDKPSVVLNAKSTIKIPWRSFLLGTQQVLAFEGPGNITLPSGTSKLNFSAEIQGNFKTGQVNIKKGNIWLEKFGQIFVSGKLVNWGKETCEIEGDINNLAVDQFRTLFGIQNLPFAGIISGHLSITINKDIIKSLRFDVNFSNLLFQRQGKPLTGHAKGVYDLLTKKCFVETGNIVTQSGGKVSVKGFISPEEFNLKIESAGVNLEEIISQLPEKWQEKIKFKGDEEISVNVEGLWKKRQLPFLSGFIDIPGEICLNNIFCSSCHIKGCQNSGDIDIEIAQLGFGNLGCNKIKGTITRDNDRYQGDIFFNFYDGKGKISFTSSESGLPLSVYAKADVERINLEKLIHSVNPEILVTGAINLICFMEVAPKNISVIAKFDNVPARPFSQKLNISAVKALASLGSSSFAGSIGKQFGSNNFYYRRLGGLITYQNGLLTIEGTVKKAGNQDYLVSSEIFGSGINVVVDNKNNSIHIEDLKQRIKGAIKHNNVEMEIS